LFKRKGLKLIDYRIYGKTSINEVVEYTIDFVNNDTSVLICVDDTGIGCFTKNTKLMTLNGWKNVDEIKIGDKVFSKDQEGNITIETVLKNKQREKTRIINIDGIEFAWSHLLYYKTRPKHKPKLTNWEEITKKKSFILDNKAWKWKGYNDNFFILKEHSITMPYGGKKLIRDERKLKIEIFALFLGWFISEGHLDNYKGYGIGITQKKGTKKAEQIKEIIKKLGFKFTIKKNHSCESYLFYDKILYNWLSKNCFNNKIHNCYNIKVPKLIKNSTVKIIELFLTAFRDGDGYMHKGRNNYCTSSKFLVDDILELIYKKGSYARAHIKHKKGSKSKIENRILTRTIDIYNINEWSSNKNVHIISKNKKEYYDNVYQITITGETKLLYNKITGKDFWSHNGGVTDYLEKFGFNAIGINNAEKAIDNDKYNNRISEMWFEFKKILPAASLLPLQELKNELVTRFWKMDNKNRRCVESKDEYKKRGFKSPDLADALLLCYAKIEDYKPIFMDL
jgi:hypothetical protein